MPEYRDLTNLQFPNLYLQKKGGTYVLLKPLQCKNQHDALKIKSHLKAGSGTLDLSESETSISIKEVSWKAWREKDWDIFLWKKRIRLSLSSRRAPRGQGGLGEGRCGGRGGLGGEGGGGQCK